jgi:hypothetical protein
VSLRVVANTINDLLIAKKKISYQSAPNLILDMYIYYKNPSDIHKAVLLYLTGSDTWTQSSGAGSNYVVMENRRSGPKFVYIEFCFPWEKLKYHFFETPPGSFESDPMAKTYKNTELRSFISDAPFFNSYKEIFATRDNVHFPAGSKEWHAEGTDLIVLKGVFSILHTHQLQNAKIEYTFFEHEHMTYYAASLRIPLRIESVSIEHAVEIIEYLCDSSSEESEIKWHYIKSFMNNGNNICEFRADEYNMLLVLPIKPFSDDANFRMVSFYFLGIGDDIDNLTIRTNEDGAKTIKFQYLRGFLPRKFHVEWKSDPSNKSYWIVKIVVTEIKSEDFLTTYKVDSTLNVDKFQKFSSRITPPENKFLTTLHLLNRVLDTAQPKCT